MSFRTACNIVWFLFLAVFIGHTACLAGPEFKPAAENKSVHNRPPPDTEERSDGGHEASASAVSHPQPVRHSPVSQHGDADATDAEVADANADAAEAEELQPEFATGILLYTCDNEPPIVNLPRGHGVRRCEETAVATAFQSVDGEAYEVTAPFVWQSAANWVTAEPVPGNKNHPLAYFGGSQDLFDGDGETEPEAQVSLCAANDCPAGEPACAPEVCRDFKAVGVVNLESHWLVSDTIFAEAGEELIFIQDGRHLRIEDAEAHPRAKGGIMAATVSWENGDLLYVGLIAPDRNSFAGTLYEQINGTVIGSFEGERLPSQEH